MVAEPLRLSAAQLARAIRAGELSVARVIDAHIARIEAVNPLLNAVITPTFERAREEAAAADRRIAEAGTSDLPPLFGVPATVKDCWPVAGVRFTAGSWHRRDDVAERDAEVVKRLRAAGAIVLGKTNLPDMSWGIEATNPVFGRTKNPRDPRRSAGGSSGGEGAIVAAGGSALGIGSDMGGSARSPAACNGCVALKPTAGRIPAEGHVPEIDGALRGWNHPGVLARRIEDLALALGALSSQATRDLGDFPLEGVRCVAYVRNGMLPVSRRVADALAQAANELQAAGMEVVRDDSLPIERLSRVYGALVARHAIPGVRRALGGGTDYSTAKELAAGLAGKPRISREALAVATLIERGGPLARLTGDHTFERLAEYELRLLEAIGDGVLLCPALLRPPPRHRSSYMPARQVAYTVPFNATGMPAVVVPVDSTKQGLPLAVQVVAREGEDELALAVAARLERAFGGWRMASVRQD